MTKRIITLEYNIARDVDRNVSPGREFLNSPLAETQLAASFACPKIKER